MTEDAGDFASASFEDCPRALWSGQSSVGRPASAGDRLRTVNVLVRTAARAHAVSKGWDRIDALRFVRCAFEVTEY